MARKSLYRPILSVTAEVKSWLPLCQGTMRQRVSCKKKANWVPCYTVLDDTLPHCSGRQYTALTSCEKNQTASFRWTCRGNKQILLLIFRSDSFLLPQNHFGCQRRNPAPAPNSLCIRKYKRSQLSIRIAHWSNQLQLQ